MAKGNDSNAGCFGFIALVAVASVLVAIPAGAWIAIGVIVAVIAVILIVGAAVGSHRERQEALAAAAEAERRAQAVAEEKARVARLGKGNAKRVDAAVKAAQQVAESEAAREGWLGEVDFSVDIAEISDGFERAVALRGMADELKRLDAPTADDRRILAEATATVSRLEEAAKKRADLIAKCAVEARLIDESLRKERADAWTAEQRSQLHGELAAMLYGIEAAPPITAGDSGVDRVMARVAGYREVTEQIRLARAEGFG
ncbi:hypothetical protein [Gordonia caeni]|uniref:Uncharacterized protein n=1 Tax=Gordonia caeni TaxID=1007097 RepID=A0ABP7PS56_9ACTN